MRRSSTLISTVLALLVIALVAAACGLDDGSDTTDSTKHMTPTTTPDSAVALAINLTGGDSTGGLDLTLVGETTVGSPARPYPSLGIACGPALVYASPDPTKAIYSASDIQAMRTYVSNVPLTQEGDPIPDGHSPSSLRWVSSGNGCAVRFDIHNSGSQDETISAVGLQLVADPVPNTYRYALLDLCSISTRFRACQSNSGALDDGYIAHIGVGDRAAGAPTVGSIDRNPDEPEYVLPLLLAPGQTTSITVFIGPKDPTAPGAIYQVVPQLTVFDSTTHVVTFSGVRQRVVFSDTDQLACFGFPASSGAPPSEITDPDRFGPGCLG